MLQDRAFTPDSRSRYLLYACHKCGRLVTCLQVEAKWAEAEKANIGCQPGEEHHPNICVCGSRQLAPANASVWQELTSPAIWRLWWVKIARPYLRGRFGV